ncbi:MAG TPA: FAD-binding oxidoreductase [Turneriella sp.]|nr:FAD-binding oxidoreductase [Turneriella sp.]
MKQKTQTRNPVGWGYIEEAITPREKEAVLKNFHILFPKGQFVQNTPLTANQITLTPTRIEVNPTLAHIVSIAQESRLLHAVGRSFRDLAKLREVHPLKASDAVATPTTQEDLLRVLEWASQKNFAVIPFGGGSSVVGGVNPEGMDTFNGVITVDLQSMNRVLDVNRTELVVHAEAGILGPALDAALKLHKMHTRYSPQSFHHSTLGGWIATRGAGHNATVYQKIETRVQSVEGVLANGRTFTTRPLSATSVSIDPQSYWTGSEGMLGFITAARLRVYPLPEHRAFRAFAFPTFAHALDTARHIAQSELFPVQVRVLDEDENAQTARLAGVEATGEALLILGDESTLPIVEMRLDAVGKIALECAGKKSEGASRLLREWVRMFFRQPYLRDMLIDHNVIVDTFETSITWAKALEFHSRVKAVAKEALIHECGAGHVGCRVTHIYSDGLCLYYSFYGLGKRGALTKAWQRIKHRVSAEVIAAGGTISHHHAMGRDHRAYAHDEFSKAHRSALHDLKKSLDPQGIMNPGLCVSPPPAGE